MYVYVICIPTLANYANFCKFLQQGGWVGSPAEPELALRDVRTKTPTDWNCMHVLIVWCVRSKSIKFVGMSLIDTQYVKDLMLVVGKFVY